MRRIAGLWGVRVVNAYGSTETNSLALPCPAGHLHLTEDRHLFEVVDPEAGTPLPDGTRGELIVTSLLSRGMPLIRYRTGDLVAIGPRPCRCGQATRVITHHGRIDDCFIAGGRTVHRVDLEELIASHPGTDLYYVADTLDSTLAVQVVLEDGAGPEACESISRAIFEAFGVAASVAPIARDLIFRAMDRKLKPGALRLEDLERVGAGAGAGGA
jgi:phenylacetate-CoA ligase